MEAPVNGGSNSNCPKEPFEDEGIWAIGFWASPSINIGGTTRYMHFNQMAILKLLPNLVAVMKKCRAHMPQGGEDLYDESNKESSNSDRNI
ncbi:hypothetical protein ACFX14_034141 [Malus domestica]